jgi:hypothetical protein
VGIAERRVGDLDADALPQVGGEAFRTELEQPLP